MSELEAWTFRDYMCILENPDIDEHISQDQCHRIYRYNDVRKFGLERKIIEILNKLLFYVALNLWTEL